MGLEITEYWILGHAIKSCKLTILLLQRFFKIVEF